MKGTELTPEQIESARQFVAGRMKQDEPYPDEQRVTVPFGDIARIVAWYGALRYQAGATGIGGTFERPGPFGGR